MLLPKQILAVVEIIDLELLRTKLPNEIVLNAAEKPHIRSSTEPMPVREAHSRQINPKCPSIVTDSPHVLTNLMTLWDVLKPLKASQINFEDDGLKKQLLGCLIPYMGNKPNAFEIRSGKQGTDSGYNFMWEWDSVYSNN